MSVIDRFVDYKRQPEFEKGDKTAFSIALRRGIRFFDLAPHLGPITDTLFGNSLSEEVQGLKLDLAESVEDLNAFDLISHNMLYLPNELFLRASPWHMDNWTRDTVMTAQAIPNPDIQMHLLDNLAQYRTPDGQIPTNRFFGSNRRCYFDDESTMLALLLRSQIAEQAREPLKPKEKAAWEQSLNWVRSHVVDGQYVTPAGTERSWFDTFIFDWDVITYNQGVYAVSLMASERMGLELKPGELKSAVKGYQDLAPLGRMQFTSRHPYTDVSSLFGEYFAITEFGAQMLPSEVVKKTGSTFSPDHVGWKVVAKGDGSYLKPDQFNSPWKGGHYHNGAEWPYYSALARRVLELHKGALTDSSFWESKHENLYQTEFAEYIETGHPAGELVFDPKRRQHAINAAIYTM